MENYIFMSVCVCVYYACLYVFVDIYLGMKKEGEKKERKKENTKKSVNLCVYQFVYS